MKPLTVLVTGATGLVGAEVVHRLADDEHRVIAVLRSTQEIVGNDGRRRSVEALGSRPPGAGSVASVAGDITRPHLGLPLAQYQMLCGTLDRVVHSAAVTDFGRPLNVYELVNVAGTRNVVKLAAHGSSEPIPLVHVSTAYVCGERVGVVSEKDLNVGQRFGTEYERSKFKAELAVRRGGAQGMPFAIVRPSIVVGTERDGVIRDFKNIYPVLKILTEGKVKSVPAFYDATLDLVPVDHVAATIVATCVRFNEAAGKTFHAVGPAPLKLRDFSDVMAEYPPFHVPRYLPPAVFSSDRMPVGERLYYERIVRLYESFFRRRVTFSSDATLALLGKQPRVGRNVFLRRLIDYCLRTGYLGASLPSAYEVLAGLDERAVQATDGQQPSAAASGAV